MTVSTTKSTFWRGLRDGLPFVLVITPFALLFGVVATEAGLTLGQAMGFNVLVIAGSAQFAAVSLMAEDAPLFLVLATALAVNLRMAMYSAALVPHLGDLPLWKRATAAYLNLDQTYAASVLEYERHPGMRPRDKFAFFLGVAAPLVPAWFGFALIGALLGAAIPPELALDFAMPITFLALIAPMMKTLAHLAAAGTSIVVALAMSWVPSGLGLLIAAGCAMAVGAAVETWQERAP